MVQFVFVGERPSEKAYQSGYTWKDGRLAARTLFDALDRLAIPTESRSFLNLFGDRPDSEMGDGPEMDARLKLIRHQAKQSIIVGMGSRVSRALKRHSVAHVAIVHPAARGKIRAKEAYIAHVALALQPMVATQ